MTLDEIQARADAASKELDRLAGGNPGTNWRWSIPAQPDRDTDLILSASQMDVPRLVAALRAVEARCDESEKASIRSFARTFDGSLFDAMLSTREIRAAIREALGS